MPPLTQTCISKHVALPQGKRKYLSKSIKSDTKYALINRKAKLLGLSLLLAVLSFSTVGCASLQALEPTADLINDLKKIL
ncbi:hypothetical protein [uncultured Psychrobacter sp.]|uniref:hypothetical protein n=1 Tax=uncultured Psychrobacter sp. TaxID=259303 RepID=UPI00261E3217|nr:hypothetical protein [uncultured Psychrobacter sp.]